MTDIHENRRPRTLCRYRPEVDLSRVVQHWDDPENPNYRWIISIPFRERTSGRRALVIMLNPSWTDADRCDRTVYTVHARLHDLLPQIEWVDIVNLWAYRDVSPAVLARSLAAGDLSLIHREENDRQIESAAAAAEIVIAGFGSPPADPTASRALVELRYLERLAQIKAILGRVGKEARAVVEPANGYPYHGRHWFREQARGTTLPAYSWKVLTRIERLRAAAARQT